MSFNKIIKDFAKKNSINLAKLEIDNFTAYKIDPSALIQILNFVKTHEGLRFTILTDLFAADFPNRAARFEVVYSLLSLKLNKRLILKLHVAENQKIPSIAHIYEAACWYEREIFDMFGVEFENAKDLRRILTDYGFIGHPLRKDFPLTGHLQVKYDESLKKVIYEPVLLEQEYRNFDFTSPWEGPASELLPGDEKANK